jgi:hypothetical protein
MRPLLVLMLAFAAALLPSLVRADCTTSDRPVPVGRGQVSVRDYSCAAAPGRAPVVKYQLHRLSAEAASVILDGRSSPLLNALVGRAKLVTNSVSTQFRALLRDFGEEMQLGDELKANVKIGAGTGGQASALADPIEGRRATQLGRAFDYPSIYINEAVQRGTDWPKNVSLFYSPVEGDDPQLIFAPEQGAAAPRFSVKLWRHLDLTELNRYEVERERYNTPAVIGQQYRNFWEFMQNANRGILGTRGNEFVLERNLALQNLPSDFVTIVGFPVPKTADNGCEPVSPLCCWRFSYYPRKAVLDVVVIENVTARPIRIDGVHGGKAEGTALRPLGDAAPAATTGDALAEPLRVDLAPGEKILVSLRTVFLPPDLGPWFRDVSAAQQIFSQIQAASGAAHFKFGAGDRQVRKTRQSFRPPTVPKIQAYAYGAQLTATGLGVNGERIPFTRRRAQAGGSGGGGGSAVEPGASTYIDITIESGIGSCPYLAFWNGKSARWIETGKILDKFNGKAAEGTEERTFEGFQGRFRLTEIEPEVAHIDRAVLRVSLRTGRTLLLEPDNKRLRKADGDYVALLWGDAVDFAFKLPAGIKERDVLTSTLVLSGYYERYSTLAAAAGLSAPLSAGSLR